MLCCVVMSLDRIARFVSGVDAFLPYQQDRVAPLPVRSSSSSSYHLQSGVHQQSGSFTRTSPNPSFTLPASASSASFSAAVSLAPAAAAGSLPQPPSTATDSVLFPLVGAYQPLATFNVAYYHRVKVRYLFLFSLLSTLLTLAVLVVYGSFFHSCATYLLPVMASSAAITIVLPLLTLCQREIAGRWYTTLAFSFLLAHFASFTWWSFSPSKDDILTSYGSLSPAVLLLCSYFLMNLSTALLFAVLTFLVELVQSVLILIGRPDIPNNVSLFESEQVWLYLLDCGHVCILFLLVFLLLHAWQQEHEGDLREAERLLVDTQRRAEQNNLNKSVFMSALAHDIRTPLNGIMAGLALTLDDPVLSLSSEHRDYLQMAHSSASSLLYLLNDILDISRLDSCSLHFEKVEFDLIETVERTVRSFALDAERQSLQLMVDISTTVPAAVRGDPVRLGQLLSNILSNALKFSERGCAVTVSCQAVNLDSSDEMAVNTAEEYDNSVVVDVNKKSVRFVPVGTASSTPQLRRSPRATTTTTTPAAHLLPVGPTVASSTARSDRHPNGRVCLHFSVRDEGCGIPSDRLQSVFGRFEQASHDVAQLYAGRGLGLAIAAGLVRLFDGKIWCESTEKQADGNVQQQHGSTFHFLIHLDLLPSDNHTAQSIDDDSSQTPSRSSPLSTAPVRHLDSAASSPTPKSDESILTTALARVRRLASKQSHSRSTSVAAQAATPTLALLPAVSVLQPAGQQQQQHHLSSRVSAVSARLLSQATGSGTVGGTLQLRGSVSVSTGEPGSVVQRRELNALRVADSSMPAGVNLTVDCKAGKQVAVATPRSPSGPSNERRLAWQRWCTKYAAVLVCITPQQTRQTVAGWVREWQGKKRVEGRAEEERSREPVIVALTSEGQLMSSVSEHLSTMQLHRSSPISPRRESAHVGARIVSRSSVSSTLNESAALRDDMSPTSATRMLLIIDDFMAASTEPAATQTVTTSGSALAAAVGVPKPHTPTPPTASPNLSFPSAARHTHLTRNRRAAKCLKMLSTLLKARQCDVDVQIDVLFLLSAGSAAMRVDWPGLRYSGSMTSPASRLSLYRLLDAAATGMDGGGNERTVLYRSERVNAMPQASPHAPLLSLSAATATLTALSANSIEQQIVGGGSSSRTNSPAPHLPTLSSSTGHISRLSDATSGLYVPSSRSALAQPILTSFAALQKKQGEGNTARRQANEPSILSPHRQRQQQQQQQESVAADSAVVGSTSGAVGQYEVDKEQSSPQTLSASSSPRPRPPLLLHAHSSDSLNTNTTLSETRDTSTHPLPSPSSTVIVANTDPANTDIAATTTTAATVPPPPSLSPSAASAARHTLSLTASLSRRSESMPAQPQLARDSKQNNTLPETAKQSAALPSILPAIPSLPPPQPLSPSRSVSAPTSMPSFGTVLVVDDNLINRKMAASVLKRMGLQSQLCESGEEAMSVFRLTLDGSTGVSRFVCCLMDIRMPPGMSGHECTRLMREWEKQQAVEREERVRGGGAEAAVMSIAAGGEPPPRLPIFALTANVLEDDRQLAVEVGMDAYLEKPLNAALLKQQLTKFGIATLEVKNRGRTGPKN